MIYVYEFSMELRGWDVVNPIEHDLLPKQKPQKRNLNVRIDLYHYTNELYNELISLNIIVHIPAYSDG